MAYYSEESATWAQLSQSLDAMQELEERATRMVNYSTFVKVNIDKFRDSEIIMNSFFELLGNQKHSLSEAPIVQIFFSGKSCGVWKGEDFK